jgi:hypothetical protein
VPLLAPGGPYLVSLLKLAFAASSLGSRLALCLGSRSAVAVAISALRSGCGRPTSHKHPSGGPLGLTVPEVRRQQPQRCHEHALRLLLAYRPPAPPLADRRIAHSRALCRRPTTCQTQQPLSASSPNVPAQASKRPVRNRIAELPRSLQQAAHSQKRPWCGLSPVSSAFTVVDRL